MKGFSLLEVLITITIIAICACAFTPLFTDFFSHYAVVNTQARAIHTFSSVRTILQTDLNAMDLSRVAPEPYISNDAPNFSDGSAIKLSIPKKDSTQWFAFVRPWNMGITPVKITNALSHQIGQAQLCNNELQAISATELDALAVCDVGVQEISIQVTRKWYRASPSRELCWDILLKKTSQLVIREHNEWNLTYTTAIHPLSEKFFYYTSNKNEFRRAQIESGVVVENQPVLSKFPAIAVTRIVTQAPRYRLTDEDNKLSIDFSHILQSTHPSIIASSLLQEAL